MRCERGTFTNQDMRSDLWAASSTSWSHLFGTWCRQLKRQDTSWTFRTFAKARRLLVIRESHLWLPVFGLDWKMDTAWVPFRSQQKALNRTKVSHLVLDRSPLIPYQALKQCLAVFPQAVMDIKAPGNGAVYIQYMIPCRKRNYGAAQDRFSRDEITVFHVIAIETMKDWRQTIHVLKK